MDEEREPDHTEDPRQKDTGQGYPEEGQPDPGHGEHAEEHGDTDTQRERDHAPGTASDEDGDPDQATGNRGAAGG